MVRWAQAGARRQRLTAALTSAYGAGLLSDETLARRMDLVLSSPLIEPERIIGDLSPTRDGRGGSSSRRRSWGAWPSIVARVRDVRGRVVHVRPAPPLLALDWSGQTPELTIGRDPGCDVVLTRDTVSRRHAVLSFRDGRWILKDLGSRNGTRVNRRSVARCRVQAGDLLDLGGQALVVD